MTSSLSQKFLAGLRMICIAVLVLGIVLRFVHLDRKIYWQDEAITSLRVAGYTETEFIEEVVGNQLITVADLKQYQVPNPEKGLIGTLYSLASEDPQLPPLYFVLVRWGMQLFGNSIAVIRSVSAILSLLAFPCLYWLCWELFQSSAVSWIAVALLVVSPFHLLFAQEARPYSLWTVTLLFSSAALLRALRLRTKASWGLYTLSVGLGLYSFLFNAVVVFSHGLYVLGVQGWRWSRAATVYCLAAILGGLTFVPWAIAVAANLSQANNQTSWTAKPIPFLNLAQQWLNNLNVLFLDGLDFPPNLVQLLLRYLIAALAIYALYFLWRHSSPKVWLFVFTLIGVMGAVLVLPDLILGGRRSGVTRYATPCYLGIEMAVAYLLAAKTAAVRGNSVLKQLWRLGAIALISGGLFSSFKISKAVFWWNKGPSSRYPQLAQIVNKTPNSLVMTDGRINKTLSFSYRLDPNVHLLLLPPGQIPQIPTGFSDIFLFNSTENLEAKIEAQTQYALKKAYDKGEIKLWQLIPNSIEDRTSP